MSARVHGCFEMGNDSHRCGKLFTPYQCLKNFCNIFGLLAIVDTNLFMRWNLSSSGYNKEHYVMLYTSSMAGTTVKN